MTAIMCHVRSLVEGSADRPTDRPTERERAITSLRTTFQFRIVAELSAMKPAIRTRGTASRRGSWQRACDNSCCGPGLGLHGELRCSRFCVRNVGGGDVYLLLSDHITRRDFAPGRPAGGGSIWTCELRPRGPSQRRAKRGEGERVREGGGCTPTFPHPFPFPSLRTPLW